MSEDLIRRSDAIDALKNALCELGGDEWGDGELGVHADDIDAVINGIPTIEPKRGEWIDEADKYDASFGIHDYRCSNCNSYADEYIGGHEWYTMYKPNYCPNCGAYMKGADDE